MFKIVYVTFTNTSVIKNNGGMQQWVRIGRYIIKMQITCFSIAIHVIG